MIPLHYVRLQGLVMPGTFGRCCHIPPIGLWHAPLLQALAILWVPLHHTLMRIEEAGRLAVSAVVLLLGRMCAHAGSRTRVTSMGGLYDP